MNQTAILDPRTAPGSTPLLDPRREKFALTYSATGNTLQSLQASGFNHGFGRKLLYDEAVAARIRYLNEQQFKDIGISAEQVKRELGRVAMASGADLFDAQGRMIDIAHLPDDVAATITGIDVEVQERLVKRDGEAQVESVVVKKIRRADKMAALALLARHFKIVGAEDDGVNALATALADRLNAAKRRALSPVDEVEDAVPVEPRRVTDSSAVEDARIIESDQTSTPSQESDDEQLW